MTNFIAWAENEVRRGSGVGTLILLMLICALAAVFVGFVALFILGHYIAAALILPGVPSLIVGGAYIWREKE